MEIGIIGLGKLGLPMAAVYASRGHSITGVDSNENTIKALLKHTCPIDEPGLDDLLQTAWVRCMFTNRYQALQGTDMCFVIVPTPSGRDARFSNEYVEKVLAELHILEYNQPVVIVSTVMPGSCRQFRQTYGLKIVYNPEFIALGSVIKDMLNPDSILVGVDSPGDTNTEECLDTIIALHRSIHRKEVYGMTYENAELAKLALNCYVTMKITFANEIASMCERMKGGDAVDVLRFIGSDSRVGRKYLKSGLGFGGPCFPRDNEAFEAVHTVDMLLGKSELQRAVIDFNNSIPGKVSELARTMTRDIVRPNIVVLGTSYKPNTTVKEKSQGVMIADLVSNFALVRTVEQGLDLSKALQGADLVIICLDTIEFMRLDLSVMNHRRVLDCWHILQNKEDCDLYRALGVGA